VSETIRDDRREEAPDVAPGENGEPAQGTDPEPLASAAGGEGIAPGADESAQAAAAEPAAEPAAPTRLPVTRVVVDVPASSANLGAGYDALALALDIRDRVVVTALPEPGLDLAVTGEGAADLPTDSHNRFFVAFEIGLRWALGEVPSDIGWRVRMLNEIPLARGLGSSAAATVAGLVAADAMAGGGRLDMRQLLTLAAEIEGHPDNAAAALLGGFVVVSLIDGRPEAIRFDIPRDLRAVLFVPVRPLSTGAMRATLPHDVPHRDAVFNVGRAALGVAALATGRLDLLRATTEDRLHEPYRAAIFPALPVLVAAAREAGALGACLSGSGSSVIAFADSMRQITAIEAAFAAVAADLDLPGSVQVVAPRRAGATVVEAE
jgi:homoserine kinase